MHDLLNFPELAHQTRQSLELHQTFGHFLLYSCHMLQFSDYLNVPCVLVGKTTIHPSNLAILSVYICICNDIERNKIC